MIDAHTHLEYGNLEEAYVLEFVEEAKRKGITTLHILDHTHRFIEFESIYEPLKEYPQQKTWLENKKMKFKDTLKTYDALIQKMKSMDLGIEVKFGLEVCYSKSQEETIRKILEPYTFDFLVGAIHSIDNILYDMPFSKELLWDTYPTNLIYERYYKQVFHLLTSNLFTQLAHPDTIKMFNYYPSYDLTQTYELLALLAKQFHICVENNTGCHYRYHHEDVGLSTHLYNILEKYNVPIISASDAHKPADVGSYIHEIHKKTFK